MTNTVVGTQGLSSTKSIGTSPFGWATPLEMGLVEGPMLPYSYCEIPEKPERLQIEYTIIWCRGIMTVNIPSPRMQSEDKDHSQQFLRQRSHFNGPTNVNSALQQS